MRELFDEDLGSSSLDPEESVRNSARAGHRNRFYTSASVRETPEGFAVLLDDVHLYTAVQLAQQRVRR